MTMRNIKKWQFMELYEGLPNKTCIQLHTEAIPVLQDGDVLFEAMYISFDPYIGLFLNLAGQTDVTVIGQQLARVMESKDRNYQVGDMYHGSFGWRTHTIINPSRGDTPTMPGYVSATRPVPDTGELPPSLMLGIFGMPGISAFCALLDVCKPQAGETVFISSAAGVVGSVAGQIAKLKGCRVIGCAGSEDKISWLKQVGFDEVFNYKTSTLDEALSRLAPKGIDVYIENVGGEFGNTVIGSHMATGGRVVVIGSISTYTKGMQPHTTDLIKTVLEKSLTIQGFIIFAIGEQRFKEAQGELIQWVNEGKIQYKETVLEGFESMLDKYIAFMKGASFGKTVMRVAP